VTSSPGTCGPAEPVDDLRAGHRAGEEEQGHGHDGQGAVERDLVQPVLGGESEGEHEGAEADAEGKQHDQAAAATGQQPHFAAGPARFSAV